MKLKETGLYTVQLGYALLSHILSRPRGGETTLQTPGTVRPTALPATPS